MTPPNPDPDTIANTGDETLAGWLKPQPLAAPQVDPGLPRLHPLQRSAEVLRYTAQRTERWLSPKGLLREWLRRNTRLALVVAIPLIVLAPVITLLLDKLQGWSASALQIASNLAQMPVLTAALLLSALVLCRWLLR